MARQLTNHQVVFEGSSTAHGYGDESRQGGFCGRVATHLIEHCQANKERGRSDYWVYTANFSQVSSYLPQWAVDLRDHLTIAAKPIRAAERGRRLGIFVVEGHPLALRDNFDSFAETGLTLTDVWRDSFDRVQGACMDADVQPILVQMPPPERFIGAKGHAIHQDLKRAATRAAVSMDDAPLFDVGNMLAGHDTTAFLAADRMHPSGLGHELIFRHLLPVVYEKLGLVPHEPLPDPNELL